MFYVHEHIIIRDDAIVEACKTDLINPEALSEQEILSYMCTQLLNQKVEVTSYTTHIGNEGTYYTITAMKIGV